MTETPAEASGKEIRRTVNDRLELRDSPFKCLVGHVGPGRTLPIKRRRGRPPLSETVPDWLDYVGRAYKIKARNPSRPWDSIAGDVGLSPDELKNWRRRARELGPEPPLS